MLPTGRLNPIPCQRVVTTLGQRWSLPAQEYVLFRQFLITFESFKSKTKVRLSDSGPLCKTRQYGRLYWSQPRQSTLHNTGQLLATCEMGDFALSAPRDLHLPGCLGHLTPKESSRRSESRPCNVSIVASWPCKKSLARLPSKAARHVVSLLLVLSFAKLESLF